MSTDTIHSIAQCDTPSTVQVPKTLNGLIVWAVGRFGGGVIIAAAAFWALQKVYADHEKQTDRMISLIETRAAADVARARSDSELALAIVQFKSSIDDLAKEARLAHAQK